MKAINYVVKQIADYVDTPRCKESLESLFEYADTRERSGFEKWLQFELVLFFKNKNILPNIEQRINLDGRKKHDKSFLQMDLEVELKKGELFGIELKVRRKASGAVRALRSDLRKHSKAKKSEKSHHCFAIVFLGESLGDDEFIRLQEEFGSVARVALGERITVLIAQEN